MINAQHGDIGAYDCLIAELYLWLKRYYGRRLPIDAVEDTTQEALMAIHAGRDTYIPSRPFGPWMAAIARYKWVDRIRQDTRVKFVSLNEDIAVRDHGAAVAAAVTLAALLNRLKPGQADAVRIVKLEGETVERAAVITGQSQALIKVNVHRGLKRLSVMLSQSGRRA
jgi:RNA polymerase sigma-70 factor (ECF subfamily)